MRLSILILLRMHRSDLLAQVSDAIIKVGIYEYISYGMIVRQRTKYGRRVGSRKASY